MSGHKAIKEWENIPTVYEERKTMSKSIEEILEKYGMVSVHSRPRVREELVKELNTKVQQEVEDGVRGFIENKIKGTGGLEERFCDWNAPEYWDIDIKTTPIEVENWVVEQAEQYLKQLKKGEEWVWCTECGKEKVYDGTMCSGCREWLIK